MRIFVAGGSGQVGLELKSQLCCLGEVFAPSRMELDLANALDVKAWLDLFKPTLIVNAAAFTDVDGAEQTPDLARRLNESLPEQLATYAAQRAIQLVHYSTDYVYDGSGTEPRKEEAKTAPVNVYGLTKLAGDIAIQRSGCFYLIFRTSWVYSAHSNNFMNTMLRLGMHRKTLSVVDDQIGAPTPARLIALVTQLAISKGIESGIYHLAPRGHTSWFGFAKTIFKHARNLDMPLTMDEEKINAIPSSSYPTPASRPPNSRLSIAKIESAVGIRLPYWRPLLVNTLEERCRFLLCERNFRSNL